MPVASDLIWLEVQRFSILLCWLGRRMLNKIERNDPNIKMLT